MLARPLVFVVGFWGLVGNIRSVKGFVVINV